MEEELAANAAAMEKVVWRELEGLDPAIATTLRGKGLFFAIVINNQEGTCIYC